MDEKQELDTHPRKAHGRKRMCSVDGCEKHGKGAHVTDADAFGPPGLRCIGHGGGWWCSVKECTNLGVRRVPARDSFGSPGLRCKRHGGGQRCSVNGCTYSMVCRVPMSDSFGLPGLRCKRHGGKRNSG